MEEEKPAKEQRVLPKFETNTELLFFLLMLIKENKKWWLIPWLLVLAFLGLFVSLTGNTSILPVIYALF